jgi:hypothetical protein
MNTRKSLGLATLLIALNVGYASASPLTVYMNAHVVSVDDPGGALGGQLLVGQTATGQYTYETSVPDQDWDAMYGSYPQGSWQASSRVSAGPLVFESDSASPNWDYDIWVHPSYWPGYYESHFRLMSSGNKPLGNEATVEDIRINFVDQPGYTPTSESLPTGAPNLQQYSEKTIEISGSSGAGWYFVVFAIDSVSTNAPPTGGLTVSPAAGSFVQTQRFDAAVLLPSGSTVSTLQSTVNGLPSPLGYPGFCHMGPPNSQARQSIICPNAASVLQGGVNSVEWSVELASGAVLQKSVEWELIP